MPAADSSMRSFIFSYTLQVQAAIGGGGGGGGGGHGGSDKGLDHINTFTTLAANHCT